MSDEETRATLIKAARERCQDDFWYWCRLCLGDLFTLPSPEFHHEIADSILEGMKRERGRKGYAIHAPREFAKSTLIAMLILWLILTGRKQYAIIFSASEDNAMNLMSMMKYQLEHNMVIAMVFGPQASDVWRADFIQLKNGGLIRSLGIGSRFRGANFMGKRPDICALDDVETDKSVLSKEQTDWLLKTMIYKVIRYLSGNIDVIMVGTILHFDSVLAQLLDPGKYKDWTKMTFKALTNGESIWPEKRTTQELEEDRRNAPLAFASEMQGEPIGDGVTPFREEYLRYYRNLNGIRFQGIVQAVDLATGNGGDNFVHVTVGLDHENRYFLLDLKKGNQIKIHEQAQMIIFASSDHYNGMGPDCVCVESIAYQDVMRQYVSDQMVVPTYKVTHQGRSKISRIMGMEPIFATGKFILPMDAPWLGDFVVEYTRWRPIENIQDDQLDAIQMAVRRLQVLYGPKIVDGGGHGKNTDGLDDYRGTVILD